MHLTEQPLGKTSVLLWLVVLLTLVFAAVITVRTVRQQSGSDWHVIIID